ncbi:glycoside hydrolase family 43 protein [Nocardia yunnanensis]|uniref:glycoside hydrolase family 43 protein n=1 Tax=Nocardia yunnanensis TaxID=2382165 RepID=UPI001656DF90|nr:glycoside hydrolase family 43 protein [Nocardia yunnanensis]
MELSRRTLLAVAAGVPLQALLFGRATAAPTTPPAPTLRYTMTAFTNGSETDLHVYESSDATTFREVAGAAYTPPTGLLRDPSLIRHRDGRYYITYTTGWEGHTIGFARSDDRITWTHLYDYEVKVPGVTSTWAPEWFVDRNGEISVLVSLSDGYRFTPHLMTATDAELRSWTPLSPMVGLEPADDVTYGHIDTTVVLAGGKYYAFTKNESTKYIELAVAEAIDGRYSFLRTDDWAGWGAPREGPSVIRLPGGGWRIFFDAYEDGAYLYSDSHDDFRTWTTPVELPGLSGTVRHFTVLAEAAGRHDQAIAQPTTAAAAEN